MTALVSWLQMELRTILFLGFGLGLTTSLSTVLKKIELRTIDFLKVKVKFSLSRVKIELKTTDFLRVTAKDKSRVGVGVRARGRAGAGLRVGVGLGWG